MSPAKRRQIRQNNAETVAAIRSRSRFNPNRGRTRLNRTRPRTETRTTTTTTPRPRPTTSRPLRSRFRPRTIGSQSTSTANRANNRFVAKRPSTPSSLFDYDYYDYEDEIELESSQNAVPTEITATHLVPVMTVIPVRENGRDQFRDILTQSPSLEVIAATALKSTNIDGSPVIYAHAETNRPTPGTKVITFEALRATETTAIRFTPTRIRGLRTSFSHIVPSTIYNIQPVTTEIIEPVDQNQLLSQLLLNLLGGQDPNKPSGLTPGSLPGLPSLPRAALPPAVKPSPTQFITHTNTYVTTLTNTESTVLPITLRGREIKTTLVESKIEVVTATEFSTETIITPTAATGLPGIPGLGAVQSPIQTLLPQDLQQQLLALQLQQQLQQQQQQLNQQILSQVNLDGPELELETQAAAPVQPDPPQPATSIVTKFVSGKNPGEFSVITSTVFLDEKKRRKRDILSPSPVLPVDRTNLPDFIDSSLSENESNFLTPENNNNNNEVVIELDSGLVDYAFTLYNNDNGTPKMTV